MEWKKDISDTKGGRLALMELQRDVSMKRRIRQICFYSAVGFLERLTGTVRRELYLRRWGSRARGRAAKPIIAPPSTACPVSADGLLLWVEGGERMMTLRYEDVDVVNGGSST